MSVFYCEPANLIQQHKHYPTSILVCGMLLLAGCATDAPKVDDARPTPPVLAVASSAMFDVIEVKTLRAGTGLKAVDGDTLSVHYTGWLFDAAAPDGKGRKFDSSVDRNQPLPIVLGQSRVIKGWRDGLPGAQAGNLLRLNIPASSAYGERGFRDLIPPNSALVFEIEVLRVTPAVDSVSTQNDKP
jgi:FKBP-type peptidyl-prolyl cis-trans isomerase FkpA